MVLLYLVMSNERTSIETTLVVCKLNDAVIDLVLAKVNLNQLLRR
ncbi:hypothetical protein [cyanobacterium endosymbiont of Epithemia turgida]|nr:hypothetical protein [cyanobacterium endosymbiont of Epithemia turgida]